jgi:hypothetical protein
MVSTDISIWSNSSLGQALVHMGWWIFSHLVANPRSLVANQALPAEEVGKGKILQVLIIALGHFVAGI